MCTIGAKYIDNLGWVGFKNRDRNYHAIVKIRTNLDEPKKMYIWDTSTKYSEGINEHGMGILLASLVMSEDKNEITLARKKEKNGEMYYSPVGKKIRQALSYPKPDDAINFLVTNQVTGHILVFNESDCFCLEGALQLTSDGKTTAKYDYLIKKVLKSENQIVRSNHGVLLTYAGYQNNICQISRKSSEIRKAIVEQRLIKAKSCDDVIDAFSRSENTNSQYNPIRYITKESEKQTTGQIMIIPKLKQLLYRPIMGELLYDSQENESQHIKFDKLSKFQIKTTANKG